MMTKTQLERSDWSAYVKGHVGEKYEVFADIEGIAVEGSDTFDIKDIKLSKIAIEIIGNNGERLLLMEDMTMEQLSRFIGQSGIESLEEDAKDALQNVYDYQFGGAS